MSEDADHGEVPGDRRKQISERLARIENELTKLRSLSDGPTYMEIETSPLISLYVGNRRLTFGFSGPSLLGSLVGRITASLQSNGAVDGLTTPRSVPPQIGELLICAFVPLARQRERLGDFEEMFTSVWVPRFGNSVAKWVYVVQAVRSVVAMAGIGLIAAVADRLWRVLSR